MPATTCPACRAHPVLAELFSGDVIVTPHTRWDDGVPVDCPGGGLPPAEDIVPVPARRRDTDTNVEHSTAEAEMLPGFLDVRPYSRQRGSVDVGLP